MADLAMCRDHLCPSKNKCYRYLAMPSDNNQSYADFQRKLTSTHCDQFILANCCETSIREWGPGNYTGEEADCLFCNRTHQWTGTVWRGVYP